MAAPASQTLLNTVPPMIRILETNGKVTGIPAAEMLRKALFQAPGEKQQLEVLDNACGAGVVAGELFRLLAEQPQSGITLKRVVAADIDDKMTGYVRGRISKDPLWAAQPAGLIEVASVNQESAPQLADGSFSHVFSNFGVFFGPNDGATLAETFRILKSGGGGLAGFTSWKQLSWWNEIVAPALAAYVPEAPASLGALNPAVIFPSKGWNDAAAIRTKLETAGFADVEVHEYAFTPTVEPGEFADACAMLAKGVAARLFSAEENAKFADQIGPALLRYMQDNFEGGRWTGKMVAFITLGKKP